MNTENWEEILGHSYATTLHHREGDLTRLEFLSDYIFNLTTYDGEVSELFARKMVEVVEAITLRKTFDYIKTPENYQWYLVCVNFPFFQDRIEWGSSVRGAWWVYDAQKLDTCGVWCGDAQVLVLDFPAQADWVAFVQAVVAFANAQEDLL